MPEARRGADATPDPITNTVDLGFDGSAPPVQPVAGWIRALVMLGWMALLASILLIFAFPDWSDAQVKASEGMVLRDAQWSGHAGDADEHWVTLPHRTSPLDTPDHQPLPAQLRAGAAAAGRAAAGLVRGALGPVG